MNDTERVMIALEEYRVLHTELLQRNTMFTQMIGVLILSIVTVIGVVSSNGISLKGGTIMIAILCSVMLYLWKFIDGESRAISHRIIEIESYVNDAAEDDTNTLLCWERRFGILSRGYVDRFKRFNAKNLK